MLKEFTWEFAIKFISLFIVVMFTGFFITSSGTIALIGWFIMVFTLLPLVTIVAEEVVETKHRKKTRRR